MAKNEIFALSLKDLYDLFLEYFRIEEIVSPGVHNKYIERLGWHPYWIIARFDKRLIETMVWIRINYGQAITINNWVWGGRFDERGLRDSSTPMLQKRAANDDAWISMHPLAGAFDYDAKGQTAFEHRNWLEERANELPHPIRLEDHYNGEPITWVHIDVAAIPGNPKVYRFNI